MVLCLARMITSMIFFCIEWWNMTFMNGVSSLVYLWALGASSQGWKINKHRIALQNIFISKLHYLHHLHIPPPPYPNDQQFIHKHSPYIQFNKNRWLEKYSHFLYLVGIFGGSHHSLCGWWRPFWFKMLPDADGLKGNTTRRTAQARGTNVARKQKNIDGLDKQDYWTDIQWSLQQKVIQ